jgi:hypothetical protein
MIMPRIAITRIPSSSLAVSTVVSVSESAGATPNASLPNNNMGFC